MRQIQIDRFGPADELHPVEVPDPVPGPGEVLVAVEAAGVNPIDYKIREGTSKVAGLIAAEDFPVVLGRECCGRVEAVGPDGPDSPDVPGDEAGGGGLQVGDRVFGMVPLSDPQGRCYAEKVVVPAEVLAPAPDGVDPTVLGGASLAAYTAWRAARDLGRVAAGETVLIHGAGGGVGQLLVQLCVRAGADVYGTCSAAKADRVCDLGATPIDYATEDFAQASPRPDLVIDGVYFDTFERSLDHLAPGGRIVVLPTLADLTPAVDRGIEAHIPGIAPDRAVLAELAEGLAEGTVSIEVSRTYPLTEAAAAHRELEAGHARGKVVLVVAGDM